jgi:S1-C subfamily serine protease
MKIRDTLLPATCGQLLLVLFLCAVGPAHADLSETITRVKPSIVAVGTFLPTRSPQSNFGGTGFVIADGRHVVTNAHVIPKEIDYAKKERLAVFVGQGSKASGRNAKILAMDEKHDLCLLSIAGKPLPALELGTTKQVKEGNLYAFTGFPIGMVLGLQPVTHRGIVSAITPMVIPALTSRQLSVKMIRAMREPYNVFQLDATAYPGNSGSPLYEVDSGQVVGVINSVLVKSTKESALENPTGISYAIPIDYLNKLLKKAGVKPR